MKAQARPAAYGGRQSDFVGLFAGLKSRCWGPSMPTEHRLHRRAQRHKGQFSMLSCNPKVPTLVRELLFEKRRQPFLRVPKTRSQSASSRPHLPAPHHSIAFALTSMQHWRKRDGIPRFIRRSPAGFDVCAPISLFLRGPATAIRCGGEVRHFDGWPPEPIVGPLADDSAKAYIPQLCGPRKTGFLVSTWRTRSWLRQSLRSH
jgi:hypothetical protein